MSAPFRRHPNRISGSGKSEGAILTLQPLEKRQGGYAKRILALCCAALLHGFVQAADGRDTLMQVSTIDALLAGLYDGELPVGELMRHGDLGIGTFHALDGEMIVLDGQCYQAKADGTVRVAQAAETTPFATVTFFDKDRTLGLSGLGLADLQKELDAQLPTENYFYAFLMEGTFKKVRVRSVPAQAKPYLPLAEVTKAQTVFEFENVRGVVVGFRSPPFVKGINVPGYHLHFLSEDRKSGGHVLDLTVDQVTAAIDDTPDFFMQLPRSQGFGKADLTQDREAELNKVEK